MITHRRRFILSMLALPAGCTIQPLKPIASQPIDGPAQPPLVRPPLPGQSWTYRLLNQYNSALLATVREQVASVGARTVILRQDGNGQALPEEHCLAWGQMVRDPAWDVAQNYETPIAHWPAVLQPGASEKVNTHYRPDGASYRLAIQVTTMAKAWERVSVPAGSFDVLRVEKFIRLEPNDESRKNNVRRDTIWLAPETGRWVARETTGSYVVSATEPYTVHESGIRWELSAWS